MQKFCYSFALVRYIDENIAGSGINGNPIDNGEDDDDSIPGVDTVFPNEENVEMRQDVTKSAAVFVAKMKASTSTVQSTIDHVVTEAFNLSLMLLKTVQFLQGKNIEEDENERQQLLQVLDQFKNPVFNLETSYQKQHYLEQSGHFIKPRQISLGIEYHPRYNPNSGHVEQVPKHGTFQYVQLHEPLKAVLENKGFMRKILGHCVSDADTMRDFHDGLFCRDMLFSDPSNISLLLYVDECEIANPLGSKAGLHKIGVIYCTVLILSPRFRSSLCNCFLVSLFNAGDVKTYGYDSILQPLVNGIQLLE